MQVCQSDESRTDNPKLLVTSAPSDGTGVHPECRLVNREEEVKDGLILEGCFTDQAGIHEKDNCVNATFTYIIISAVS